MRREMEEKGKTGRIRVSASFKVGAIALAFMILGYQVALFVREAAVSKIVADRDCPDTVFVYIPVPEAALEDSERQDRTPAGSHIAYRQDRTPAGSHIAYRQDRTPAGSHIAYRQDRTPSDSIAGLRRMRKDSAHSPEADAIFRANVPRRYESFAFNPNDATVEELMRLGLTAKQAQSIDSYRKKGGRFRRKADFAKSYVISDTLFSRLEPFILIPKLDINLADSAAFDALPGIGPYFASKMVRYRERLGGYSYPEQLLEIWKLDSVKFAQFSDLIEAGPSEPYPLWTLPEDSLSLHPYITRAAAHGIVLFRSSMPQSRWSVSALREAGVLSAEDARRLSCCRIAGP